MDWVLFVWRVLCGLMVVSGVLALCGVFLQLPPVWQGVLVVPGLVVMLLMFVAWCADSGRFGGE